MIAERNSKITRGEASIAALQANDDVEIVVMTDELIGQSGVVPSSRGRNIVRYRVFGGARIDPRQECSLLGGCWRNVTAEEIGSYSIARITVESAIW